ncbi:MAG TPA: 23S rRNA (uracil(1939)-C(5))-methyltransferase RlmD, partial [Calditrichia bacterium]|nr:23S rRNA (uracil(1939)-C(5))-methyltransferase RlmD [Calditrichia bacterium]
LLVRKTAGGVMVVVVATSPALPAADLLTETLRAALPTLKSLYLHYNDGAGNAVLGGEDKLLWGAPFIEEDLAGLRFRIFPGTFFQVNPGQMTRILDILDPLLDLRESDLLVDLYCGVGAIALRLASRVREVIGVEFNPDAVSGARENARLNGIQNAAFEVGDAGTVFTGLLSGGKNPDVVVLDPPRKGLEAGVLQALLSAMPRQIAYLSCNPQTLLRDLQQLCAGGFRISRVLPFDMFPQTYHLETLAILEKS